MAGRTTPKGTQPRKRKASVGHAPRILRPRDLDGLGYKVDESAVAVQCRGCGWMTVISGDRRAVVGVPPRAVGKSAKERALESFQSHARRQKFKVDKPREASPRPDSEYFCECGARPPAHYSDEQVHQWFLEHHQPEAISG